MSKPTLPREAAFFRLSGALLLGLQVVGCGDSERGTTAGQTAGMGPVAGSSSIVGGSSGVGGSSIVAGGSDVGGASHVGGSSASGGGAPAAGADTAGGSSSSPTADDVAGWIDAYKAAHPGNGGKDWDINAKTPEEVAADPDAQRLLALCGEDQRPVIPLLAWEYGGGDHPWQNPEMSALVYCVYIPVDPSSAHWMYDAGADRVDADLYVLLPEQNPCRNEVGADQVMACLGDPTNVEILVDTASLNDGADAGLSLSEASTDLYLLLPDASRVHMYTGL